MQNEKYIDEIPAYQRKANCQKCRKSFFKKFEAHNICNDCEEEFIKAIDEAEEEYRQEELEREEREKLESL